MASDDLHPVVLSGPSGVGKSTLLKRLFKEFPDSFGFSVSHTTRGMRDGEQDGTDYHFVTSDTMNAEIARNSFIEWASFAGKMYGTSIAAVEAVTKSNRICILDIDEQGVKNIKGTPFKTKCVFVTPPSFEDLEKRLRARGTETDESLKKRMDTAHSAIEFSKTGVYDKIVVNDNVDLAYSDLKSTLVGWFPSILSASSIENGGGDAPCNIQTQGAATIEVGNFTDDMAPQEEVASWYCSIL